MSYKTEIIPKQVNEVPQWLPLCQELTKSDCKNLPIQHEVGTDMCLLASLAASCKTCSQLRRVSGITLKTSARVELDTLP
jgi:hypothetical protein